MTRVMCTDFDKCDGRTDFDKFDRRIDRFSLIESVQCFSVQIGKTSNFVDLLASKNLGFRIFA